MLGTRDKNMNKGLFIPPNPKMVERHGNNLLQCNILKDMKEENTQSCGFHKEEVANSATRNKQGEVSQGKMIIL